MERLHKWMAAVGIVVLELEELLKNSFQRPQKRLSQNNNKKTPAGKQVNPATNAHSSDYTEEKWLNKKNKK